MAGPAPDLTKKMIIRRLAEAIKNHNWFTVLIEFVIVVAGIFVGLQVNDWNEARLDRARESVSLERLLDEAEVTVAYIRDMVENMESMIGSQRELLKIMSSDSPLPRDTGPAAWGFESLNFMVALTPPRTVYDELAATGGLRLIRSHSVREAISMYYATLRTFQSQLNYFRDVSISAGADQFFAARDYVKAEYDPDNESGRRFVFDWSGLRADADLRSMFVTKLRNQIVINNSRRQLLGRAQIMCDAIAKEINGVCDSARAIEPE